MTTTHISSANVSAGKPKTTGSTFVAPPSTTGPTDATTALASGFESVGYIGEDGISNEISISSEDIKEWSGGVVMSVQTEKTDTFKFKMIESLNENAMKVMFGDANVTKDSSTGVITVKVNASEPEIKSYVIEMVLSNGYAKRIYIPRGKVTETGEVSYVPGDATGYDVTITALPDDNNNTHYEYIQTK